MHALLSTTDGRFLHDAPWNDVLAAIRSDEGEAWIDLLNPSREHLAELEAFDLWLPEELRLTLTPPERPFIDTHDEYYYFLFYSALWKDGARIQVEPIFFFVSERLLLTIHSHAVPEVFDTMQRWHAERNPLESRIGPAVHALLDALLDDYFPMLDEVADLIDELETSIFEEENADPIQTIFVLKKQLLNFRRIVAPERDVLNILLRRDLPVFQNDDMPYVQDLYYRIVRMAESIDLYRDLLSSALDSFVSMQSNRLNIVIKVLTVASIILMSNALIAGIYGMNFVFMPELHWTLGYPFALLLMAVLSVALVFLFKKKGLL